MNESSTYSQSSEATPEPKMMSRASIFAGAFTGIFSVLLLSLLLRSMGFDSLAAGFLFPGYWLLDKINSLSTLPAFLIAYGVSSIPPVVIGILIFANKDVIRIAGVLLLGIYAFFWTIFSFSFIS